jgi:hypothetical protein
MKPCDCKSEDDCKKLREYDSAVKRAKELAKLLKEAVGGNWKCSVWENLGWHFSLQCGTLFLSEQTYGFENKHSYLVLTSLNKEDVGTGHPEVGVVTAYNPITAVKKARKNLENYFNKINEIILYNNKEFNKNN